MPLTLKGSTSGGVTIDVPAIAGNNTLTFPAATGTALIGTTTTANQVFFGGATSGTLSQDSSLFWDNTNKRLGVGTANPSAILDIFDGSGGVKLQIKRDANAIFQIYQGGSITYLDAATAGGTFSFLVNAQEKMRLDAFGNLGLGVTPSAYAGQKSLQVASYNGGFAAVTLGGSGGDYGMVGYNVGFTSSTNSYKYQYSSDYSSAVQFGSGIKFLLAGLGTAGNPITFTQAMTLDASGRLGIGITTPSAPIDLAAGSGTAVTAVTIRSLAGNSYGFKIVTNSSTDDVSLVNYYAAPLIFGTNNTERARFNAGAPILCLSGGSTTATGTGIAFPATQSASSDANTLDEYEEGTFSPTITSSGTAPTGVTYANQAGQYTRVGRLVTFSIWLSASWTNSPTGTILIQGLPFTPSMNTYPTLNIAYHSSGITYPGARTWLAGEIQANTATIYPYANGTGINGSSLTIVTHWASGSSIEASGFYYAAT